VEIANLQEKSDASPGKCSMNRIILNCGVPDLLEEINPPDDLAKQVHNYDGLSTLSGISPFFIDAFLLCVFGKRMKF